MARLTCALGPDNAGTVVLGALRSAEESIDATVYEIGASYQWAFTEAVRKGVAVRVVVDPRSEEAMRQRAAELSAHGVDCRLLAQPGSRAHAKLIVIDKARVAVGSGNLNTHDLPFRDRDGGRAGTREWWLVADDVPTLAKAARAHVMRNWRAAVPALAVAGDTPFEQNGPPIHPVIPEVLPLEIDLSPRRLRLAGGGSGVRALEQDLLSGVHRRALVIVPYVSVAAPSVAPLLGALTAHKRRGLDVRLLLGQPPDSDSTLAMLSHLEVPVRFMDSEHVDAATTGHAKGIVMDDTALVGSANWSESGLSGNDEAAMSVNHKDAATYYADAFERDWELAVAIKEA